MTDGKIMDPPHRRRRDPRKALTPVQAALHHIYGLSQRDADALRCELRLRSRSDDAGGRRAAMFARSNEAAPD